jgi:hypothetical protein
MLYSFKDIPCKYADKLPVYLRFNHRSGKIDGIACEFYRKGERNGICDSKENEGGDCIRENIEMYTIRRREIIMFPPSKRQTLDDLMLDIYDYLDNWVHSVSIRETPEDSGT